MTLKWEKKKTLLNAKKDASYLKAQCITSALMILPRSFKLGTREEVNEDKSRYNSKTPQTSSAGGQ